MDNSILLRAVNNGLPDGFSISQVPTIEYTENTGDLTRSLQLIGVDAEGGGKVILFFSHLCQGILPGPIAARLS